METGIHHLGKGEREGLTSFPSQREFLTKFGGVKKERTASVFQLDVCLANRLLHLSSVTGVGKEQCGQLVW